MRKTSLVLAVLLAVAGICVMLWPVFTGNRLQSSAATAVQEFFAERNEPEQQYPELLAALQEYNQRIYAEKQCIYANYDIAQDRPCDTLELNLCKGDGTEENWSYHLNAAEQEVLARKMEAFCQQQNGMSLHDFARQLQEEPGPSPQIQM